MQDCHAHHPISRPMAGVTAVCTSLMILATPAAAHDRDHAFRQRSHIEKRVRDQLGARYSYGGASPSGFDCSGLTRWTYREHGAALPHSSMAQFYLAKRSGYKRIWKQRNLKVGDLVFHKTTSARVGHVGIYIGGGRFISTTSSEGVRVRSLDDPHYWGPRWVGATRLPATMNTRREYRSERARARENKGSGGARNANERGNKKDQDERRKNKDEGEGGKDRRRNNKDQRRGR